MNSLNTMAKLTFSKKVKMMSISTPLSISNCQLWLDSGDVSTINKNASNIVSSWNDKSGFSRHATNYITTQNVVYNSTVLNGKPAMLLTTGGMICSVPPGTFGIGTSPESNTPGAITGFVVYQNTTLNTLQGLISRTSTTLTNYPDPFDFYNDLRVLGYNNNSTYAFNYFSTTHNISNVSTTNINIFCFKIQPSKYSEYNNGNIITSESFIQSVFYDDVNSSNIYIGTRGDKYSSFTGKISEVILYNKILSSIEQQQVEGYLATKWRINPYLPFNHPFYTFYEAQAFLTSIPANCYCLYASKWINNSYKGPILKLRRNNDTTTNTIVSSTFQDFYIDILGNMVTMVNVAKISLADWLSTNGATSAYVVTWYDQSGFNNHASQHNSTYQPIYDILSNSVNLNNNTSLYLPITILLQGKNPYTISYKFYNANLSVMGNNWFFHIGTNVGQVNRGILARLDTSSLSHDWDGSLFNFFTTINSNPWVTLKYDTTNNTKYIYYNKSATESASQVNTLFDLDVTVGSSNSIGSYNGNNVGNLSCFWVFRNALTDADRNIVESTY